MAKLIAIKGSKDGLRLQLDERAAWEELLEALRAQISQGASFFNGAQLVVDIGERGWVGGGVIRAVGELSDLP